MMSGDDILPKWNAGDLVSLQRGQDFPGKPPDLLQKHFLRQRTAVEADLDLVGAGGFGGAMILSVTSLAVPSGMCSAWRSKSAIVVLR